MESAESIGHIHRLPVDEGEDRVAIVNGDLARRRDADFDHIELDATDTNGDDIVVTLGFDGGGMGVGVRWLDNDLLADLDLVEDEQPGHTFRDTTLNIAGEVRIVKMGDADV